MNAPAIFCHTDCFEVTDLFTFADSFEYIPLLFFIFRRHDQAHRLSDRFGSRIPEEPLGAAIPGSDQSVQRLRQNCILGGLDYGCQPGLCLPSVALGEQFMSLLLNGSTQAANGLRYERPVL